MRFLCLGPLPAGAASDPIGADRDRWGGRSTFPSVSHGGAAHPEGAHPLDVLGGRITDQNFTDHGGLVAFGAERIVPPLREIEAPLAKSAQSHEFANFAQGRVALPAFTISPA